VKRPQIMRSRVGNPAGGLGRKRNNWDWLMTRVDMVTPSKHKRVK
jgi:hypothetical protein